MEVRHKKLIRKWADESLLRDLEGALENQPLLPRLGWGFQGRLISSVARLGLSHTRCGNAFRYVEGEYPSSSIPWQGI